MNERARRARAVIRRRRANRNEEYPIDPLGALRFLSGYHRMLMAMYGPGAEVKPLWAQIPPSAPRRRCDATCECRFDLGDSLYEGFGGLYADKCGDCTTGVSCEEAGKCLFEG